MTARSRQRALLAMTVLAAVWLLAASRVHVNASWSDGAWGYLALPVFGDPGIGDVVLFDPPEGIGADVPYLKTVRGLPGARVQVGPARTVVVDSRVLGAAKARARDGRPLAAVAPGIVPPGHYFLHGPHRDSHDSRYAGIGFVPRDRIRARAVPLPDLPWLGLEGPLVGPGDRGP
ncbi:MAG: S26 family signal peptidase [Rhodospirillales bacterium]|nr:S26 family signal peptidase [Rhodospirillales bacterium]